MYTYISNFTLEQEYSKLSKIIHLKKVLFKFFNPYLFKTTILLACFSLYVMSAAVLLLQCTCYIFDTSRILCPRTNICNNVCNWMSYYHFHKSTILIIPFNHKSNYFIVSFSNWIGKVNLFCISQWTFKKIFPNSKRANVNITLPFSTIFSDRCSFSQG